MDIDEATHFVLERFFFPPAAASTAAGAAAAAIHLLRNVAVAIMTKTAAVRGQCYRAVTSAAVKMDP